MPEESSESIVLAVMVNRLDAIERKLDHSLSDHERRLRSVERWVYALPGATILAIGALVIEVVRNK